MEFKSWSGEKPSVSVSLTIRNSVAVSEEDCPLPQTCHLGPTGNCHWLVQPRKEIHAAIESGWDVRYLAGVDMDDADTQKEPKKNLCFHISEDSCHGPLLQWAPLSGALAHSAAFSPVLNTDKGLSSSVAVGPWTDALHPVNRFHGILFGIVCVRGLPWHVVTTCLSFHTPVFFPSLPFCCLWLSSGSCPFSHLSFIQENFC